MTTNTLKLLLTILFIIFTLVRYAEAPGVGMNAAAGTKPCMHWTNTLTETRCDYR